MESVNVRYYVCECCRRRFDDIRSASKHELYCRQRASARDALMGKWVSAENGDVKGLGCMGRASDSFLGVMNPLNAGISWCDPVSLHEVDRDVAMSHFQDCIGTNIAEATARAQARRSDGPIPQ